MKIQSQGHLWRPGARKDSLVAGKFQMGRQLMSILMGRWAKNR
jgi:hypothetical protein